MTKMLIIMQRDVWWRRPAAVWFAIVASHAAACALVWWLA